MPRRARVFYTEQPGGAAPKSRFARGTGSPFWQTPTKMPERRKQAASSGFLLTPFLWQKNAPAFSTFTTSMSLIHTKKSSLPASAGVGVKSIVTVAKQLTKNTHICNIVDGQP